MDEPWAKAYVYGLDINMPVAHIVDFRMSLCGNNIVRRNRTPDPYPVCKNCLRTKRAKEMGVFGGKPNLRPMLPNEELP